MLYNKKLTTKLTAAAIAFSMVFASGAVIKVDAAGKKPTLNKINVSIKVGGKTKLSVKANGNKISKVTWKSTKPKVAVVSKKGVVTAKKVGKAQVKATFTVNGSTKRTTLKCLVTVDENAYTPITDWKTVSDPRLDLKNIDLGKAIQAFVADEIDGINCEPFALLAKSKSSENYRVFCRITPVVPDAKGYYAVVEVGLDREMNIASYNTVATTREIYEALPKEPGDTGLTGGMMQAETPSINEVQKPLIETCLKNEGKYVNKYMPIALLGTQVVNGTQFLTICEREIYDGYAYFLVNVCVDSAGKATVGDIYPCTLQDEDYSAVTNIDPNIVERDVAHIRNAIAAGTWGIVAAKISYPITFRDKAAGRDVTVKSAEEFLALDFVADPSKMDKTFLEEVTGSSPTQLRPDSKGFVLGENEEICLNDVNGEIKITAINGITGLSI